MAKITSTRQDKASFRNLQRFYSYFFSFSIATCAVLVLALLVSLLSIIQINIVMAFSIAGSIVVLFGPLSVYLKAKNKNNFLRTPAIVPEKALKAIRNASLVFFILALAFGILFFLAAPIKPDAGTFTDKVGREYSYNEYLGYLNWELTYIFSWSIFALLSFAFLPISDKNSRKWWKFWY